MGRIAGFTLIEMLVTIAVYGLVIIAAADLLRLLLVNTGQQALSINALDAARKTESDFTDALRDASYGVDGSYPVIQASSSQIIFFSPFGYGSSVVRIRYFVSGTTLYRGITQPSGSAYNLATEAVTPVLQNLSATTTQVFQYYSGTYAGTSSPLAQPVNLNSVTYVQMSLLVPLDEVRNSTSTFLVTTGASIRNLKTNLGN